MALHPQNSNYFDHSDEITLRPIVRKEEYLKGKFLGTTPETYALELVAPGLDINTIEVSIEKTSYNLDWSRKRLAFRLVAKTLENSNYFCNYYLCDLDNYDVDDQAIQGLCRYEAGIVYVVVPVKKIDQVVYRAKPIQAKN